MHQRRQKKGARLRKGPSQCRSAWLHGSANVEKWNRKAIWGSSLKRECHKKIPMLGGWWTWETILEGGVGIGARGAWASTFSWGSVRWMVWGGKEVEVAGRTKGRRGRKGWMQCRWVACWALLWWYRWLWHVGPWKHWSGAVEMTEVRNRRGNGREGHSEMCRRERQWFGRKWGRWDLDWGTMDAFFI